MILFTVLLFCFTTVVIPTVSYQPLISPETCATMGAPAHGSRDLCQGGQETLLKAIITPTTQDFLLLLIVGLFINITASTLLSMIVFSLHQRLYAKS